MFFKDNSKQLNIFTKNAHKKNREIINTKNSPNSKNSSKTFSQSLLIPNSQIIYLLTRKKVKNINLRIKADGSILVSAPFGISQKYIDDFMLSRVPFILSSLEKLKNRKPSNPSTFTFTNGTHFYYLGKPYSVQIISLHTSTDTSLDTSTDISIDTSSSISIDISNPTETTFNNSNPVETTFSSSNPVETIFNNSIGDTPFKLPFSLPKRNTVILSGSIMYIITDEPFSNEKNSSLVANYLSATSKELFKTLLENVYPIFNSYEIPYPSLTVRKMTRRWGSCFYTKGKICLNTNLMTKPIPAIEYVIAHELAHFIEANHSKAFYSILSDVMPDWRERQRLLDY